LRNNGKALKRSEGKGTAAYLAELADASYAIDGEIDNIGAESAWANSFQSPGKSPTEGQE
jgi:hypothetical protein